MAPTAKATDGDPEATDGQTEEPEDAEPPAEDDETAVAAADWLDSLEVQLRGDEVLALPYGDLDMSATPDRMPGLYPLSREREGTVLSSWETPTVPVIASAGRLPRPFRDRRDRRRQHPDAHRPDVRRGGLPPRPAGRR